MKKNYLFGFGERLTQKIKAPGGGAPKKHPYSLNEAVNRLERKLVETSDTILKLSTEECPNEYSVFPVTLHPSYLAKSFFPDLLLKEFSFKSVGSRPSLISPEKITQKVRKLVYPTTNIFISGKREKIRLWSDYISNIKESEINIDFDSIEKDEPWLQDFIKIEEIKNFQPGERIKKTIKPHKNENLFEVVLHCSENEEDAFILDSFEQYCIKRNFELDLDRRMFAQGLCFIPLLGNEKEITQLENHSFVRFIRRMPGLKIQGVRGRGKKLKSNLFQYELPKSNALDNSTKVAIFDAGIPDLSPLHDWVSNSVNLTGTYDHDEDDLIHGEAVTSAYLFGPLSNIENPPVPYTNVDHYKVYDYQLDADEDLYHVLDRIKNVLSTKPYDFVNISVSPEIPVEDDYVHLWTASLDEFFSDGKTLATIAAGNSGERDVASGLARIQVPADCVNGLSVGAINSDHPVAWNKASYSCLGPGRSPGIVKPDIVTFGGHNDHELFYCVNNNEYPHAHGVTGTSVAAPYALRIAAGIKATFGAQINPLTCKALLIHHCDNGNYPVEHVGWGRLPRKFEDLTTSDDSTAKIIYQGLLEPSKFLRAQIPFVNTATGFITIKATFCFTTDVKAQDPSNYTNSGLVITFRPEQTKKEPESTYAETDTFFGSIKNFANEGELRGDAHKWETVLHASKRKRADSLNEPVFDIHYVSRTGDNEKPKKIPYSLVITVSAPKNEDFNKQIEEKYRNQLEVLQPVNVEIQTRIKDE